MWLSFSVEYVHQAVSSENKGVTRSGREGWGGTAEMKGNGWNNSSAL